MATSHDQTRKARVSRNLRGNRDQLRRAITGVRSTIEETITNKVLQMLVKEGLAVVSRIQSSGIIANETTAQDADGNYVRTYTFDDDSTKEIIVDESGAFVYVDENGTTLFVHSDGDSPTIKEYLDVFHAMLSYVYHNGEITAAEIAALTGRAPAQTSELATLLDAWA